MASRIDIPAGHVIIGARGGFTIPVQENGAPLDISAWTLKCTIREGPEPGDAVVTEVTTVPDANGGVNIVTGPQGETNAIRVEFTPAATTTPAAIDRGTYYYTIQREDSGNEYAIAYGSIELDMSAAR